jgi:Tol biopolymer transport system component
MLTKSGAKLLDFGLAKNAPGQSGLSIAPDAATITEPLTGKGTIIGTFQYMAPEQLEGKDADHRTDIFAFGAVLYEMATGKRAFEGNSRASLIASIMSSKPRAISELQPMTPPALEHLVQNCLAKDPEDRLQTAHDAGLNLRWMASANPTTATSDAVRSRRSVQVALAWSICGLLAVALTVMAMRKDKALLAPPTDVATKSVLTFPAGAKINWDSTGDSWSKVSFSQLLAISRDGRRLIQTVQEAGRTNLYLKDEKDFIPRKVAGTAGARGAFFSPDGLWVGFVSERTLKKVQLPGGTPQPICEISSAAFDATWLDDGTIIYSSDYGLRRVSSEVGSTSEALTTIDSESGVRGHHFPNGIPGTRSVIFTVATESGLHAALLTLGDGAWRILKHHAEAARYVESGHLLFARSGEVIATPYRLTDRTTEGGAETTIGRVVHRNPGRGGTTVHLFATSQTGVLMYAPAVAPPEPDTLVWVDHHGNEEAIVSGDGRWMHQRLSPNGKKILFNKLTDTGDEDVYIYDFGRDQVDQLTRHGHASNAEWSPDGQTICFNAVDGRGRPAYMIRADFSEQPREYVKGLSKRLHLCQWTRSDSLLVFHGRTSEGGIWTTSSTGDGTIEELINSSIREQWAQISPDGKLIAFVGFESDRREVYVRTYPELGPRVRVSQEGGGEPRWARDSRTLYFRQDAKIFQAKILLEPELNVTGLKTLPIHDTYDSASSGHQHYDLSLDGTKFLMVKHGKRVYPERVHVVKNWTALLTEKDIDDSLHRN